MNENHPNHIVFEAIEARLAEEIVYNCRGLGGPSREGFLRIIRFKVEPLRVSW